MRANQPLVCRKCSYDANSLHATHCDICGHPLKRGSVPLNHLVTNRRSASLANWFVSVLLLVLVVGGGYVFWRSKASNTQNSLSSGNVHALEPLTMVGNTFSGYITFRSAAFQEALKEVGVNLRYQVELDFAKSGNILNQGKTDFLLTTLDQFLQQKAQGKIVGLIDRTVGGDAVVLNTKKYPSLKSLLDLTQLVQQARSQGKQLGIAFAGDSPSEYLALMLSANFEAFKLSDFQVKKVADASDAWNMLQDPNQNVAVAVIWEPYVTQARQKGYTVVLSSKDVPGAIVDVIVASNHLIQSQPKKISQLLEAYYRRIDANVRDATQLQTQIAEDGKLSPSDAAAVLEGINFLTATEAKDWLKNGTLEKRIGSTAAVLTLAGRMDKVPQTPSNLFNAQLITKAADNTQALISVVRADNPELADKLAKKGALVNPNSTLNANQVKSAPKIGNLQLRGDVTFDFDSAELTDEGKQTLNQLAEKISEFNMQTVAVQVIGHTSHYGAADSNQALSQERAQVVADYLRNRGVKHNVEAEGKGFSQPLAGISPDNPRNQRTEIRLLRLN